MSEKMRATIEVVLKPGERAEKVEGWPQYWVTDQGRVISTHWSPKHPNPPVVMTPSTKADGYRRVDLRHNGKQKLEYVHRLVLEAFVGPCPDGLEACHNNGDRSDNRLENLRWGTRQENARDRIRHGTQVRGSSQGSSKLWYEAVLRVKWWLGLGHTHLEIVEKLVDEFGVEVSTNTISAIATKRNWSWVPDYEEQLLAKINRIRRAA